MKKTLILLYLSIYLFIYLCIYLFIYLLGSGGEGGVGLILKFCNFDCPAQRGHRVHVQF